MDEKQNRRAFLKKTFKTGAGLALGCGLFSGCSASAQKDKTAPAGEDFSRLAYCCLDCTACDLFIATRENSNELKAEVVKKWDVKKGENFTLEDFNCFGCKSEKAGYFCSGCTVRKCAVRRGLTSCAQCDDLESCDQKLWEELPWLKKKAIGIKAKLNA